MLDEKTLRDLICACDVTNSIRDIVTDLEKRGGGAILYPGHIYFFLFENLAALKRRVYRQADHLSGKLDQPGRVKCTQRQNALNMNGTVGIYARGMNDHQVTIILCVSNSEKYAFAPIVSCVFTLTNE